MTSTTRAFDPAGPRIDAAADKRRTTHDLHLDPELITDIPQINHELAS